MAYYHIEIVMARGPVQPRADRPVIGNRRVGIKGNQDWEFALQLGGNG